MAEALTLRINDEAIKRFLGAIPGATAIVAEEMERATHNSMATAQDFIANYPPPPSGWHMRFVSERQRRYFFWALNAGIIKVPYRRTGTLGRRWRYHVGHVTGSPGFVGVLANPTPYAGYVQDEARQAKGHRGRWPTLQMIRRTPARRMRWFFDHAIELAAARIAASVRS